MNKINNFWPNLALTLGIISLIGGLTKLNNSIIGGSVIILGSLAFKSAKLRKLNILPDTILRKTMEIATIMTILSLILFHKNIDFYILTDPVPFLIIPLWAIISYLLIVNKKTINA